MSNHSGFSLVRLSASIDLADTTDTSSPRRNPVQSDIDIGTGLIWFVAFLFSTTVHEAMHAFAAWRLGDSTAYQGGQVSLNPAAHVAREPIGMVVLPLLDLAHARMGDRMGQLSVPIRPGRAAIRAARR